MILDFCARLAAKQEDALITEKAELLAEYMFGKAQIEERLKLLPKIHEVDRKLEALNVR